MARMSGCDGKVTFSSGYDSNVRRWEINQEAVIGETLDFDSESDFFTQFVCGKRWSGSYTATVDDGETLPLVGDEGTATFQVGQTAGDPQYTGEIKVSGVTVSVEKGADPAEIVVNFVGSGELTADTVSA